jgi:chromosomal replication initiator protein
MINDIENYEKIWESVLQSLRLTLSEATFNGYLRKTNLLEIRESGDRLIAEVGCSSVFIKNTLDQRHSGQIGEELSRVTGKKCEVSLVVKEKSQEKAANELPLFTEVKTRPEEGKRSNLRADYTFENYAVGGSNQMAFAAAQAIARKPGQSYNPLFIYGGVGVGKTHLMQAIGHKALENGEGPVWFCSGEEFTNDLVEAIRFKTTEKVRNKYRKVKVLMVDDVQFIAGKPSVQEEFFHTFNAILKEGGQVIMTSDKPPAEIAKLEERLRSRFGAGLIVDIGEPDFELKTAILLIKAKQKNIDLPMEVAQAIAANVDGVRELEGFLIKTATDAEMRKEKINKDRVEEILKVNKPGNGEMRVVTPGEVFNAVGNFYGIGISQLKGERRTKTIVWPRQILMYLLRIELRLSLDEVGRLIGGRDHTTVLHGSEKVSLELQTNQNLKREMGEIKRKIFTTA